MADRTKDIEKLAKWMEWSQLVDWHDDFGEYTASKDWNPFTSRDDAAMLLERVKELAVEGQFFEQLADIVWGPSPAWAWGELWAKKEENDIAQAMPLNHDMQQRG